MVDIRVGPIGQIRAGKWTGQTIRIEDDSATTGGYYIYIGPDDKGEQGGDLWVEADDLEATFQRFEWQVSWLDG
jgi:hypothetical protein